MISLDSRTKKPKLWSLLALSLAMIPVLLILYRTGTAGGTQEIQLCTVRSASVLLCLYYMAALFLLGNAFRKQLEYNPYSYNVIYYSGFFFFTFFILEILLFLMLSSFTEADRLDAYRIAVDDPSGINADTGEEMGAYIRADETFTFGKNKTGLVSGAGAAAAGKIHVCDIGIPEEVYRML